MYAHNLNILNIRARLYSVYYADNSYFSFSIMAIGMTGSGVSLHHCITFLILDNEKAVQ